MEQSLITRSPPVSIPISIPISPPIPRRHCTTAPPDWVAFRAKYNQQFHDDAKANDNTDLLYVGTRYVVLYHTDAQKIPIERVQEAHRGLNLAYIGANTSDLAKVPNNERYPWQEVLGNPLIQFAPLDSTQISVEYKYINVNSLSGVDDAAQKAGTLTKGILNILIGPSQGTLLGEAADLGAYYLFADYEAVGFGSAPATLPNYTQGKVLIHEIGHCLGLPHPFADDVCDNKSVYPDVPEQIRPNFETELFESGGAWDCKNDNRYFDRIHNENRSCLVTLSDPSTAPNEMGVNFMDYGNDGASIMFTASQATMMRTWLKSTDNNVLDLLTDVSAAPSVTIIDVAPVPSNTGLSALYIALIVVGSLLGALFLFLIIRFWGRRQRMKQLEQNERVNKNFMSDEI